MDDTLLHSDLSISKRTRNAIKQAEEAGLTIVLASGRIPEAMDRYVRLLGLNTNPGYLISNNGAVIMESHTGKVIHEARIDINTALTICDLAIAEDFPVQIYDDDIMYVSRKNEYSARDQKTTGIRQVEVRNFRAMLAEGCHKLVILGEPPVLSSLKVIIENFMLNDATLFISKPYFLELMPRGTDKGSALAFVAKTLGVDADQVMAIGDSMNDEAMIRWAGMGVAMANADARIKSIADLVTDSTNDQDGVAEVIEKYFFRKGSIA